MYIAAKQWEKSVQMKIGTPTNMTTACQLKQ
jgi:hypothetical protein